VHLRISSPPYQWPCFYGIDTAARKDLVAFSRSVEEIRQYNGADSLAYISMDNLIEAVGQPKDSFCRACFDGEYPITIPLDVRHSKLVFEKDDPGPESEGDLKVEEPLTAAAAANGAGGPNGASGPHSDAALTATAPERSLLTL
jgi:amidophosphoribosyltransferase